MHLTRPTCVSGLNTSRIQIPTAGVISLYTRTTDIPPSGIVVTVSQSGSTTASFNTPTTSPQQTDIEFNCKFNCAAGDILTVAITSSAPIDQPPNLIKTITTLKQGI